MRKSYARSPAMPCATAILAERFRRPLVQWFRRQGLAHDIAEDCAQDSFVRLFRQERASIRELDSYLFSVASSVLVDLYRRSEARHEAHHVSLDGFDVASDEPTQICVSESREALQHISRSLEELPRRTREVFLLNRLERLSYSEIAAHFEMSVSSVEKRMMKAIAHVGQRRKRRG